LLTRSLSCVSYDTAVRFENSATYMCDIDYLHTHTQVNYQLSIVDYPYMCFMCMSE